MKRLSLFAISSLLCFNSYAQTISIKNKSALKREGELVRIDWNELLKRNPKIDTSNLQVVNQATFAQVPFQLEKVGSNEVKFLLLQVSVQPKSTLKVILQDEKSTPLNAKTYGRYVPERKDDFAWENDKIAFRMYGKALEGSNENAYGIDVWVKRTSELVINKRYKVDNYHKDHGDGLDYYSVGQTLGAGDMAPYLADSVWYLGNYKSYKILDNGPLRTTFQLNYDEASANNQRIEVQKLVSIDAGSQMNRIENSYKFKEAGLLPVAVGLATRNEKDKQILQDDKGVIGYWEPVHGEDGITGVGAVLISPIKVVKKHNQLLAVTEVKANEPVVYYNGAAWNKAGEITDSQQWFDYLKNFKQKLQQPLVVKVN
ncbi:DUF4861 family protein [Pedobacter xixiisoli]|uniref:DUF4861 domain-containing protein n=1 Tax=Pedobacter xixiisoli TaxID=1476464 RepID=A0A285ZR23_9SPHI|nr:DUF4861 family protein [Pedobacter xixiisoli]SOD12104.1 protein of unknown function [Pedobacter xixiisoli]